MATDDATPRKRAPRKASDGQSAQVATVPPFETDERIERGLLAVAAFNGNTRKASAFLAEDGLKINHQTLHGWARRVHLARYEEIRAERLPQVQRHAAEQHMELATHNMELEKKLLDDLDDKRHELAARDISAAARNAAVGTGIHTEKAQLLAGQPTSINKFREAGDVLRLLKARAPGLFIEGTVESEETIAPFIPEDALDHAEEAPVGKQAGKKLEGTPTTRSGTASRVLKFPAQGSGSHGLAVRTQLVAAHRIIDGHWSGSLFARLWEYRGIQIPHESRNVLLQAARSIRRRLKHIGQDPRGGLSGLAQEGCARLPGSIGRRARASNYVGTTAAGAQVQFDILLLEGLRPDSRVLEIGCGALHASVPIMKFTQPGCFVGMDPNAWLREAHLEKRSLRKLIEEKRPQFLSSDTFDARHLGTQFDFILSHSILSHAAHKQLQQFLTNTAAVLAPSGRILVSIRLAEGNDYGSGGSEDGDDSLLDEWVYPGVSFFKLSTIEVAATRASMKVEVKPQYTALQTARRPSEVHDWLLITHATE